MTNNKTTDTDTLFPEIEIIGDAAYVSGGLTKREYFAAMAMQGFSSLHNTYTFSKVVTDSVDCADKLIEELNK